MRDCGTITKCTGHTQITGHTGHTSRTGHTGLGHTGHVWGTDDEQGDMEQDASPTELFTQWKPPWPPPRLLRQPLLRREQSVSFCLGKGSQHRYMALRCRIPVAAELPSSCFSFLFGRFSRKCSLATQPLVYFRSGVMRVTHQGPGRRSVPSPSNSPAREAESSGTGNGRAAVPTSRGPAAAGGGGAGRRAASGTRATRVPKSAPAGGRAGVWDVVEAATAPTSLEDVMRRPENKRCFARRGLPPPWCVGSGWGNCASDSTPPSWHFAQKCMGEEY